jgi:hypothetical protein
VTWSDVALPGAFAVGIIVGGIGVIRVMRYLLTYLQGQEAKRHEREASGE